MIENNTNNNGFLSKTIANKYNIEGQKSNLLNKIRHSNKFRYSEAKISRSPKYLNKELTYGLKFGSNKTYWVMISFCLLISIKFFYDFTHNSQWILSGKITILSFFFICILFFGYKILFDYPAVEIQSDRLVYGKKHILWKNISSIGFAIKTTGKPPYEKRIVIGTKQNQIKEINVSMLDVKIQDVIDAILINVT